jgi:hypothetical protein
MAARFSNFWWWNLKIFMAASKDVSCVLQSCDAVYSIGFTVMPDFDKTSLCVYTTTRSHLPGGIAVSWPIVFVDIGLEVLARMQRMVTKMTPIVSAHARWRVCKNLDTRRRHYDFWTPCRKYYHVYAKIFVTAFLIRPLAPPPPKKKVGEGECLCPVCLSSHIEQLCSNCTEFH